MGKRFKGKTCVYCRTRLSVTGDHVFAREFFPVKKRADLPQVPTCDACNREKANLEHYLTAILPFGAQHGGAVDDLRTMVPRRLEKNKRLLRGIAQSQKPALVRTTGGILMPTMEIAFDGEKLVRWGEYVAIGLAWHHWQILVPQDYRVVAITPTPDAEKVFDGLFHAKVRQSVSENVGDGMFVYRGVQGTDDAAFTLWQLQPLGGVMVAGDGTPDRGVRTDNSDMGTVEAVSGDPADPTLRIRLDKGQTVTARWSEFVGYREENATPEERSPKVQNAYSISIHASQGSSFGGQSNVDKSKWIGAVRVLNTQGLKSESALVGMSRQRWLAAMYVETGRVFNELEGRKAGRSVVMQKGSKAVGTTAAPEHADEKEVFDRTGVVTLEDVKKKVFRETLVSEQKVNISDHIADVKAWAKGKKAEWELAAPIPTASQAPEGLVSTGLKRPLDEKVAAREAYAVAVEHGLGIYDATAPLPQEMPGGAVNPAAYTNAIAALDAIRQRQDTERAEAAQAGLLRGFGRRWVPPKPMKEANNNERDRRNQGNDSEGLGVGSAGTRDRGAVGQSVSIDAGKPVIDHARNHAPGTGTAAVASYAGEAPAGPPPAARGVVRGLSAIPVVSHRAGRGEVLLREDVRVRVDDLGAKRNSAVRRPNHLGAGGAGQAEEGRGEAAQSRGGRQGEVPQGIGKSRREASQGGREGQGESCQGGSLTSPRPSPFAFRPFGKPLVGVPPMGSRERESIMQDATKPHPRSFARPFLRSPTMSGTAVAARIADRLDGPVYPLPSKAPEKVRTPEPRTTSWARPSKADEMAELDRFGREVDLVALATKSHGWTVADNKLALKHGIDQKDSVLLEKGVHQIVVSRAGVAKNSSNWTWWKLHSGQGNGGGVLMNPLIFDSCATLEYCAVALLDSNVAAFTQIRRIVGAGKTSRSTITWQGIHRRLANALKLR